MGPMGDRAIVIGASMAGLLAARVLANHFREVVVLERDVLPPEPVARRGVPQGRQSHLLLNRGTEAVQRFFPGLCEELVSAGALLGSPRQVRLWLRGGYIDASAYDSLFLLVSRPLLEHHVRRRTLALPNVRLRHADAAALLADDSRRRVTGVRIATPRQRGGEEDLPSDLVVDAAGRGSRAAVWLEGLGYRAPASEHLDVGIGYTTRVYRRQPDHLGGHLLVLSTTAPPHWRFGVLIAQEHDRWTLSTGGYVGDHAPTTEDAFLDFVRSLGAPEIHEVAASAEPLSDLVPYKFPSSVRRRYDALSDFPDGYLVVGDALCSFNPVFGQGMTVAALDAEALERSLAKGRHQLARRFFATSAPAIQQAWDLVIGDDLRNPSVEGRRTPMVRGLRWYLDRLIAVAHHDPEIGARFLRVTGMQAAPPSLLRPSTVARVAAGRWRARRGRPAEPSGGGTRMPEVSSAR